MSDPTPVTDPDILARFNAGAPKPVDDPDVLARFEAEQPRHGAAADVALSTGTGLIKGAAALGGIGGDLAEAGKKAADWVGGKFGSGRASDQPPAAASGPLPEPEPAWESDSFLGWLQKSWEREREWGRRQSDIGHGDMPGSYQPPTSAQLQGSIENVTGPLHQPETTPGRYARTVAEFVPAALATGGESVVPSIVKGAVLPGLGSEYLGSKVEGTWMEPWARLLGALGGGVSGAAGSKGLEAVANRSAASTAARDAAAALTPAGGEAPLVTRGAVARVARNYADDELTPQNIAAQQSGLGPEAMMLDMGRQMQGRAEAIASQPGKGQNNILNQVETRTGGTNPITGRPGLFGQGTADRIKDTLDQSMGPSPDIVAYQKQVNDAVDRISKPLYDQVMTAHPVVNVPDAISSRPAVAEAMKRAVSLAKNYGEKLEGPAETKTILSGPGYHIADDVTPQAQPSLRYWDYVKKAMDQRIRGIMQSGDDLSSAEKADLGGLQSARTALVNHLDDVTGGAYAVARKVAATKPEVKDAIELGRSSLSTKLLPEELADEMQGMSLPERAAAKAGMRREIDRIIDTARNDGAAARRVLDINQNWEKIAGVFGSHVADAVDKRIAAETQFQDATNKIASNSRTAVRTELKKDTESPSISQPPSATALGIIHATGRRGLQYLADQGLERTREGIGNLVTARGGEIPTLAQILSRYNTARAANAAAPVGQQASSLARVLASQTPGWLNGYLPGPGANQSQ